MTRSIRDGDFDQASTWASGRVPKSGRVETNGNVVTIRRDVLLRNGTLTNEFGGHFEALPDGDLKNWTIDAHIVAYGETCMVLRGDAQRLRVHGKVSGGPGDGAFGMHIVSGPQPTFDVDAFMHGGDKL